MILNIFDKGTEVIIPFEIKSPSKYSFNISGKTKLEDYQRALEQDLAHDPYETSKLSEIERATLDKHWLMKVRDHYTLLNVR